MRSEQRVPIDPLKYHTASVLEEAHNAYDLNISIFTVVQTTPIVAEVVEISKEVSPKKTNTVSQVITAMVARTYPQISPCFTF